MHWAMIGRAEEDGRADHRAGHQRGGVEQPQAPLQGFSFIWSAAIYCRFFRREAAFGAVGGPSRTLELVSLGPPYNYENFHRIPGHNRNR